MPKLIESSDISFSIVNGLYMPFMYKGHQIVVHNAAWSFREKIWIDDELVINQIGVSMTSTHVLDVDGDKLNVTFGYRNGMKEIFLDANVENERVHELKHKIGKDVKPATMMMYIIGLGLAGLAFGYAIGLLVRALTGGA